MHRLFVALRPPSAIRAALLDVAGGIDRARWQDDDQLHLTVRFIGEVDRTQEEDVATAVAGIGAQAIDARIEGVGTFDRRGRIDAVWARVVPEEPLAALHRKVDRALASAGIASDTRRFTPHVTLARFSRDAGDPHAIARWIEAHGALATPVFRFTHLYLFESRLGQSAASYEAIARWPLE